MENLSLTGSVLVSDILLALEPMLSEEVLTPLDAALSGRSDDRVEFDDVQVRPGNAIDALEEADQLPEPEGPDFDETDIINLAEAIRCGERERAELLLDRIFADLPDAINIREWIDRGRYSSKARAAKAAPATQLRNVA